MPSKMSRMLSCEERLCLPVRLPEELLERYGSELKVSKGPSPLDCLGRAVAVDPYWRGMPPATLALRPPPSPVMTVMGGFDRSQVESP